MGRLFQRSRTYLQIVLDPKTCQLAPISYRATTGVNLNPALLRRAGRELGVNPDRITIAVCDDLPPNVRGAYFIKDGREHILLNSKTSSTNTVLHELRHSFQHKNNVLRTRLGLEADAQRFADMREADFQGLLTRGNA